MIANICILCREEIMYESPENFDPVCMDDDGDVHCEECCDCNANKENEKCQQQYIHWLVKMVFQD